MQIYQEPLPDTFIRFEGGSKQPLSDGSWISAKAVERWTETERNEKALFEPAAAIPVPSGKRSTGISVARVNGVVGFVHVLEDIPVPTLEERRVQAIEDLKEKRWGVEVGGITVSINGENVPIGTARGDDRNNLHIQMTLIGSSMRPDPSTFNFADGAPRAVSSADMLLVISAVLNHVQQCFEREAVVTTAIVAANDAVKMDAAIALIDTGWPS